MLPFNRKLTFEDVYVSHYARLHRFARNYVLSDEDAEDIVQDVLGALWEKWPELSRTTHVFAWLFVSVKNKCIDLLRRRTLSQQMYATLQEEHLQRLKFSLQSLEALEQNPISVEEVEQIVHSALEILPERCREIFIKNKFEEKKFKQIAEELNISVSTVDSQMSIAYKKLRKHLEHLFSLFIFFFG